MATKKSTQTEAPAVAGGNDPTPATQKGLTGFGLFLWHFLLGVASQLESGTLSILGTTYTGATLSTKVQGFIAPYTLLATQLSAVASTRAAIKADEAAAKVFMKAAVISVKGFLGSSSPNLADFGIKPAKPRTALTAEQLLVRAAKVQATRQVRHTMSTKQKKALKSTATPTVTVSTSGAPTVAVSAPGSAAPPVAPAPAVASAPAAPPVAAPPPPPTQAPTAPSTGASGAT